MTINVANRFQRFIWGLKHPSFLPMTGYLFKIGLKPDEVKIPENEKVFSTYTDQKSFLDNGVELTDCGIPKIIFQTVKTRNNMPANYRYWRNTFIEKNPDFRCLLWDDADNDAFIADQFPWFLSAFRELPAGIFRADAIRPFFLFRYGGVYADMDTECLVPLSAAATHGDVILGRMGIDINFNHSIPNAIMASKPFEMFWLLFISLMQKKIMDLSATNKIKSAGPEAVTGPVLLREVFHLYASLSKEELYNYVQPIISQLPDSIAAKVHSGKIELLEPDIWYPLDWTNPIHRRLRSYLQNKRHLINAENACVLFPQATMVTYWMHSWI